MNIWTIFRVAIFGKRLSFPFRLPKKSLFCRYLRGFWHFSYFEFLSDLGLSKKCSSVIFFFAFLTKSHQKTCITLSKLIILNLTFLISWPWMTLIWHKVTQGIGGFLDPCWSSGFFSLIRLLFPAKPAMIDNQKLDLWPDLWLHQWRPYKILPHIRKFQARNFQMAFLDRKSVPEFSR